MELLTPARGFRRCTRATLAVAGAVKSEDARRSAGSTDQLVSGRIALADPGDHSFGREAAQSEPQLIPAPADLGAQSRPRDPVTRLAHRRDDRVVVRDPALRGPGGDLARTRRLRRGDQRRRRALATLGRGARCRRRLRRRQGLRGLPRRGLLRRLLRRPLSLRGLRDLATVGSRALLGFAAFPFALRSGFAPFDLLAFLDEVFADLGSAGEVRSSSTAWVVTTGAAALAVATANASLTLTEANFLPSGLMISAARSPKVRSPRRRRRTSRRS
jgi:hypothetical protein